MLTLFTKFQQLKTKDSQMKSMELAEHATKVMDVIGKAINSLENQDYFFKLLHHTGRKHRKVPDFKEEYFFVSILPLFYIYIYMFVFAITNVHSTFK